VSTDRTARAGFLQVALICMLPAFPLAAQTSNWHGMKASRVQSVALTTFKQSEPLSVQFETWVEQLPRDYFEGVYPSLAGVEENAGKATIGRLTRDHFRKVQVGYSLLLETEPNGRGTRVSFEALPATDGTLTALPSGWTAMSPVAFPVPQLVQNGDVIKLILYERALGTRLVEYIRIGAPGVAELRVEAPRDSYAEDAEFNISHPLFRANGRAVAAGAVEDFHSAALRVRIPGFGSYTLSLKQHPDLGFENAGEVSGNSLTFMVRGNLFRIDCADRVASGSAGYNIYARLDPEGAVAEGSAATIGAESEAGLASAGSPSVPK
jgi:hypothetical protein